MCVVYAVLKAKSADSGKNAVIVPCTKGKVARISAKSPRGLVKYAWEDFWKNSG